MKSLNINIPGKTFLLGEYVALFGGPSLIFTSIPEFSLSLKKSDGADSQTAFHPQSPAGKFYAEHQALFANYQVDFGNPYRGLAGLGGSSAEFLSLYLAKCQLENSKVEPADMLEHYWRHASHAQSIKPSGADVMAQLTGGLCYFYPAKKQCIRYDWPFESLSMILVHTEEKLNTHEHLQSLKLDSGLSELSQEVTHAKNAIDDNRPSLFIKSLKQFYQKQKQLGLVASHTEVLIDSLHAHPKVLAAKGAGAMGADVIIVVCARDDEPELRDYLSFKPFLANQDQLASPPYTKIQSYRQAYS